MKTLRVNKFLRATGSCISDLEQVLDMANLNPNMKLVIGLESDLTKSVKEDLDNLTIEELTVLHTSIEKEITNRINKKAIAELESSLRSQIWQLRDLGVNTLDIDGLTISLEPTFNYDLNK